MDEEQSLPKTEFPDLAHEDNDNFQQSSKAMSVGSESSSTTYTSDAGLSDCAPQHDCDEHPQLLCGHAGTHEAEVITYEDELESKAMAFDRNAKVLDAGNEVAPPTSTTLTTHLPAVLQPYATVISLTDTHRILQNFIPHLLGLLVAASYANIKPGYIWRPAPPVIPHSGILSSLSSITPIIFILLGGTTAISYATSAWSACILHSHTTDHSSAPAFMHSVLNGRVSHAGAWWLTSLFATIAAIFLAQLPISTMKIATPMFFAMSALPLSKWATTVPDVIQAAVHACSVFIGASSIGWTLKFSGQEHFERVDLALLALSFGVFCLSLLSSLLLSVASRHSDIKNDLNNTSVHIAKSEKSVFLLLAVCICSYVELIGLLSAGAVWSSGGQPQFWGTHGLRIANGLAGLTMVWLVTSVRIADLGSLIWWGEKGCTFVGGVLAFGLSVDWLGRV